MTCPLAELRAERKAASHLALADAALRLARERGFDGFTIDDLARSAGTSRRTFFNHFLSKEDAVVEVARRQIGRVLALVAADADLGDGTQVVDRAIRALLEPETVATLRALVDLTVPHPALVPALQAVQAEAIERFAQLASVFLADTAPVYSYAFPGAVVTTVGAVYARRLLLVEIDGPGDGTDRAPVVSLTGLVDQLLALLPPLVTAAGRTTS